MIFLIECADQLKAGECINISRGDIKSCAKQTLGSLFDTVRESDIGHVMNIVNYTWPEFSISENLQGTQFTLCRKITHKR